MPSRPRRRVLRSAGACALVLTLAAVGQVALTSDPAVAGTTGGYVPVSEKDGTTTYGDSSGRVVGAVHRAWDSSKPAPTPAPTIPAPSPTAPAPAPTTPAPSPTTPAPAPTATPAPSASTTAPAACTVSAKLVPSCGAWWGVAAAPLKGESYDQAMVNLETQLGRTSDLARYYERGQSKMWPTAGQIGRRDEAGRERLLYMNWRPSGMTWRQVADGKADAYLDRLAAHIGKVHPEPLMLSLHAEMETEVVPTAGSGQTAKDFRDFFRHVTQRLRANGAPKIVTSVVYTGSPQWPSNSWWEDLYPGDDVVDWIGQDPYAMGKKDNPIWRTDFYGLVNRHYPGSGWDGFYTWAQREHPTKPMVLAEFGVDEPLDDPTYKPRFLQQLPAQLAKYPNLKAVVYWNSNKAFVGTTRLDSSAASLQAARTMVDAPVLNRPGQFYLGKR